MPTQKLIDAVNSVNWNENINQFTADVAILAKISKANMRLATWSKQLEIIEIGNPALSFIREMQTCGHLVAANTALAVYKSAASAMRSMVETALYYTYFRTHPVELATLANNPKYYISKTEVLEFHAVHTDEFQRLQGRLGLVSSINEWYSKISAIVHGQIPGVWHQKNGIANLTFDKATRDLVIEDFCRGEELVHKLFLCTVGRELWDSVSSSAKKSLLAGLPGNVRAELGLDLA